MRRREFLGALAAGLQAQAARPPNIVFLLADDLGYGELGCQGNHEIPTPNIDSIASNGVRFTNGYVTAPFCTPSRAGLITGRYQTRFGHERNVTGKLNLDPRVGLPLSEKTMADRLRAGGYVTSVIGKWHLGASSQFHPFKRGFDEFYGFLHEGHFYFPLPYRGALTRLRTNEPPYDEENPMMRGTDQVKETEYLTDAFAREATAFIDRNRNRPFFLYVPFNAIHSPMQAPVAALKKFEYIRDEQRRLFAAMIASMDEAVGAVLQKLRDTGLENDTLVIFLSDNGGPTEELTSSNAPLRGGKGQVFEGGIRIPYLVQWKSRIAAGRTVDDPVISLDLLPTMLEAAGLPSTNVRMDGVSLLPLLTNKVQHLSERALYWRYGANSALRRGDWKVVNQRSGNAEAKWELFDLSKDPAESTDLSVQQPLMLTRLRAEHRALNDQMVSPRW